MTMRQLLDIQSQLLPDLIEVLKKRYTILHQIMLAGSIGRRSLASALDMTERVLRSEVDLLKAQGLLESSSGGMRISQAGRQLLDEMESMAKDLFGLTELEKQIRSFFQIRQVMIVPGDADQSVYTKKELGRVGAMALKRYASKSREEVIAVAGGSTMAEVAEYLTPTALMKGKLFVPARGGLGETVELQANTIASMMAKRTGGEYRLLHVPDHLGEEAYQSLMQDDHIREITQVIRRARIVVHGIGDAMVMARRRKSSSETIARLQEDGALAEAFGYYFDESGNMVHNIPTIGLRLQDIERTEVVIGVAGGMSKGKAIAAVLSFGHEDVLVTDEAAALEIVKYIEEHKAE